MYGLLSRSIRAIFFRIVQGAFSTCGSLHMHSTCKICHTGFTNFCNIKTSCCNHSSHTYSKTNLSVLLFLYFVLSPALTWRANVNLVPIETLSVHQLLRPCSFNIEQWYPKCQIVQTDICSLFWTQGPNELLHFFVKTRNSADADKPVRRNVRHIFSQHSDFVASFAITTKLSACRALLFEVQWVTSPCLPRPRCLIALFSTYCHHNCIQVVCN